MSSVIDERVVEMRFDNDQFEKGAKESITTLEYLKKSLNLEAASESLGILSDAVDDVDLSALAAGVQSLQDRFSTLGIVSMRVIENITDAMMNTVSNAVSYASDAIISGGLKRAQNIENAHFQLQALLKDETAVQAVMNDAMDSVTDTAYAYDEAAKAASSLTSSGVEAGEAMQTALRGIVGVTAMTNSDYESISNIFTTVAGNGRLLGEQLLQLSSRGLNAAATIAQYYQEVQGQSDITEAKVREMVSNSEISFETFAAAMNWAFGDQAFRANETFNGILSNINAAFAKIGAGFFSPLIEQNSDLILMLNSVKDKINEVKTAVVFDELSSAIDGIQEKTWFTEDSITSLFSTIKENGAVATADLQTFSEGGVSAIGVLKKYIEGVKDGSIRASYAVREEVNALSTSMVVTDSMVESFVENGKISYATLLSAMENYYGTSEAATRQFTEFFLDEMKKLKDWLDNLDLSTAMELFYYDIEIVKNVIKGIGSVLKPIGDAFIDVFGGKETSDAIISFADKLKEITSSMKLSEQNSSDLKDAFTGVFNIVKLIVDIFGKLFGISTDLGKPIGSLNDLILSLLGSFGRGLTDFSNWVRESETVQKVFDTLSDAISAASTSLDSFVSWMGETIDTVKKSEFISTVISTIKDAFNDLGNAFSNVQIHFNPIKSIFDLLKSIVEAVGPTIVTILNGIAKAISTIIGSISNAISGSGINSVTDLLNTGVLTGIGIMIGNFIKNVQTIFDNTVGYSKQINRFFDLFKTKVNTILNDTRYALKLYQEQIKVDTLTKIAKAVLMLAAALFVIAMIDSDKLASSLAALAVVIIEMSLAFKSITKTMSSFNNKVLSVIKTGSAMAIMIAFAAAILILAVALKSLSKINPDNLQTAISGILACLFTLSAGMYAMSYTADRFKGAKMKGLISFALSILILAGTLKLLASIDWDSMKTALAGLASIAAILTICVTALQYVAGKCSSFSISKDGLSAKGGISGLISFALAIVLLTASLKMIVNEPYDQLYNALGAVAVLAIVMTTCIIALQYAASKTTSFSIGKNGLQSSGGISGLISFALAIVLLTASLKMIVNEPYDQLYNALGAVAILMIVMTTAIIALEYASSKTKSLSIGKGGISSSGGVSGLISFALSMVILVQALKQVCDLKPESLIDGLFALGVLAAELVVVLSVLQKVSASNVGGSSFLTIGASLILIALALNMLVPVLQSLGNLSLQQLGTGLLAVAGALGTFIVMGYAASAVVPGLLALGAAFALIGIGIAAMGAGVALIQVGSALSTLASAIKTAIKAVLEAITENTKGIINAIVSLISALLTAIQTLIPQIVETVLGTITEVLTQLSTYLPEIAHQVILLLIELLDTLTTDLPELATSIVNFVATLFSSIIDAIKNLDVSVLEDVCEGFLIVSGMMVICAGLSALAVPAMKGVIAFGAVATEFAAVLGVLGGLSEIPGAADLVVEGGGFLSKIGYALGDFVGSIIGGLGEGISNSFPQIGENLSEFAENASDFITAMGNVKQSVLLGVGYLTDSIIKLTEGSILSKITSLLGAGLDGDDLKQTFESIGDAVKAFANKVDGIDAKTTRVAAYAAETIATLYEKMPKEGGWLSKITGSKQSMSDFADDMEKLGEGIAAYSQAVDGKVSEEAVQSSVNAAKIISDFQDNLPNIGGFVQSVFGEQTNLETFGSQLKSFGHALANYSMVVSKDGTINVEAIQSSVDAASALAGLQSSLGTQGGIVTLFETNDLSAFGQNLQTFGMCVAAYSATISEIDMESLENATIQVGKLIRMAQSMEGIDTSVMSGFGQALTDMGNNGMQGLIDAFTNGTTEVTNQLSLLVNTCLMTFKANFTSEALSPIGQNILKYIVAGMQLYRQQTLIPVIEHICASVLASFRLNLSYEALSAIGANAAIYLSQGLTSELETLDIACMEVTDAIINGLKLGFDPYSDGSYYTTYEIGQYAAQGLAEGITSKINEIAAAATAAAVAAKVAAMAALDEESPSKVFRQIGQYVSIGMALGIEDETGTVADASEAAAVTSINTVSDLVSAISDIIDEDIDPTITPVVDLSNVRSSLDYINGAFDDQIQLATYAQAMEADSSFTKSRISKSEEKSDKSSGSVVNNNYNFVQNNTSPKSLSRVEIYRQTRNQFSRFKEAMG
jgi:hypothetical protein